MAGDWIKLEHVTPDKPEIVKMADILGIDQDSVVGKLVRIWIWADQNSVNGNAMTVTDSFLDRYTFCSGFSVALRNVGWLTGKNGCLMLPNFDRHNGQTSKNRAVTNRRVSKHRGDCNAGTVTNVTYEPLQKPLPEKRREEYITTTYPNAGASEIVQSAKSEAEVLHCMQSADPHPIGDELQQCADSFFAELAAVGWRNKRGIPLSDWRPLARKYARSWARNNAAAELAGLKKPAKPNNNNKGDIQIL